MTRGPRQPTIDDTKDYFYEFFRHNIPKSEEDIKRVDKRLGKIKKALNLYCSKFNERPDIEKVFEEVLEPSLTPEHS